MRREGEVGGNGGKERKGGGRREDMRLVGGRVWREGEKEGGRRGQRSDRRLRQIKVEPTINK